jgi:hypothetical protein
VFEYPIFLDDFLLCPHCLFTAGAQYLTSPRFTFRGYALPGFKSKFLRPWSLPWSWT